MNIRLKNISSEKNITQEEIANRIGVTKSFISRVEKGTRDISLSLSSDIADYLDISLDELAGRTPHISKHERND